MKKNRTKTNPAKSPEASRPTPPINYLTLKPNNSPMVLQDIAPVRSYYTPPEAMVRTQIYLTRAEHDFLMGEANRRTLPMAAIIREYIDEKMKIPEDAWLNNPLLQPAVDDPTFVGHEDGAINHDHYISGTPKRFEKLRGQWIPARAEVP